MKCSFPLHHDVVLRLNDRVPQWYAFPFDRLYLCLEPVLSCLPCRLALHGCISLEGLYYRVCGTRFTLLSFPT